MMGQRFPTRRVLAHQAEVNCQCYPPVLVAPATSVTVSVDSIFKRNQVELVEMTGGVSSIDLCATSVFSVSL